MDNIYSSLQHSQSSTTKPKVSRFRLLLQEYFFSNFHSLDTSQLHEIISSESRPVTMSQITACLVFLNSGGSPTAFPKRGSGTDFYDQHYLIALSEYIEKNAFNDKGVISPNNLITIFCHSLNAYGSRFAMTDSHRGLFLSLSDSMTLNEMKMSVNLGKLLQNNNSSIVVFATNSNLTQVNCMALSWSKKYVCIMNCMLPTGFEVGLIDISNNTDAQTFRNRLNNLISRSLELLPRGVSHYHYAILEQTQPTPTLRLNAFLSG